MNQLFEIIKLLVISFEFLFVLVLFVLMQYYPIFFEYLGTDVISNNEILKFLPTIPLAICAFSINYSWKILNPMDGSSNRILHEWPNYWKLKYRVLASIIICAICAIMSLGIWFFANNFSALAIGVMLTFSLCIPLIVALNQLVAAFTIRELIEP